MKRRIFSMFLAVCMAVTLFAIPVQASGFSDVKDPDTAVQVESLRALGVLNGYQDGTFRPGGTLTRAEFCKMAVYITDSSAQASQYSLVTVFPDVKPSHWAAPYINLESKGKGVILGFPDGKFYPGRSVTCGQAVTILMRLLGYTDEDSGALWPAGYMALADTVGLTDGMQLNASANLTRAQAAELFFNLLSCKTKDGSDYAVTIADRVVYDTVVISCTATAADGTANAVETVDGSVYKTANGPVDSTLAGKKGMLLLDQNGKVKTFVPSMTITGKTILISKAEADKLTDTTGQTYRMTTRIPTYFNGEESTWGEEFSWLRSGTSVTLFFDASGSVAYLFRNQAAAEDSTAVVISQNGSSTGLAELAGGRTDYKLYKNGLPATMADLKKYDVAIYEAATNSIRVSDLKISGYYESCWPNESAPSRVTVLGHEFDVVTDHYSRSEWSKLKLGSGITLLMTEDLRVAGAVSSATVSGNALGVAKSVSADSATVELLCGLTVKGNVSFSDSKAKELNGQLVRVGSVKSGYLTLTRMTNSTSSDLNVAGKTLGTMRLADNLAVFERAGDGTASRIDFSDLKNATIAASKIVYYGTDWAGRVNVLVLNDVTGNRAVIGRVSYDSDDEKGKRYSVSNGTEVYGPFTQAYGANQGDFVSLTISANGRLTGLEQLTRLKAVPNDAWNDKDSVTVGGKRYPVAEDVICYNSTTNAWITLSSAHAYAVTSDLYVDSHNIVRAVVVHA